MTPIHALLHRIRWDAQFGAAEFVVGYFDRLTGSIVRIDMRDLGFVKNDSNFFYFLDEDGVEHQVPLHRIKEVYRNGELIWSRSH